MSKLSDYMSGSDTFVKIHNLVAPATTTQAAPFYVPVPEFGKVNTYNIDVSAHTGNFHFRHVPTGDISVGTRLQINITNGVGAGLVSYWYRSSASASNTEVWTQICTKTGAVNTKVMAITVAHLKVYRNSNGFILPNNVT